MIQIYRNFEDIKTDWETLYEANKKTVFQSYDYSVVSWNFKVQGGSLYIVVYKDADGKTKAILPSYIDPKGTLRYINDRGTDICDLLYDADINLYDSMKEMCEYLQESKEIKSISLENMTCDSPVLSYFKIFMHRAIVYSNNEVSFLNCGKSDDPISGFTHLTSDRRKKLKRILKQADSYQFKIYFNGQGDAFPLEALKSIAQAMVDSGIRPAAYFCDAFWTYAIKTYEKNLLEVALLCNPDGKAVSAGFVFANSQVSVRWVILYTEAKYNLWNNVLYIETKGRLQEYENNFGRGGYDYKMGNFKPRISLLYRLISPMGNSGVSYCIKSILMYTLKRYMRHSKLRSKLTDIKSLLKKG